MKDKPIQDNHEDYYEILLIVKEIDEHLRSGDRHYRTCDGQLLVTLDQVVVAILDGSLQSPESQVDKENDPPGLSPPTPTRPMQVEMFPTGDDLPLFSGTPQSVQSDPFSPRRPAARQLPLLEDI